jgi:Protein of unknown function (DUF2878)
MPSAARLAACFAIGAVAGTLLDGLHLLGDVLSYEHEAFGDWAWFVPFEFGLAGVAAGIAIPVLERTVGPGELPHFTNIVRVGEVVLFTALYGATALFDGDGAVWLLVGLTLVVVVRLWLWSVPGDWAYAVVAAVVGPAAEIAISATGAFDYAHPDFAGIPMWLPALWANGGLLIRRLLGPVVMEGRKPAAPPSGGRNARRSPLHGGHKMGYRN